MPRRRRRVRRNPTPLTWAIIGGGVALAAATGVTVWAITRRDEISTTPAELPEGTWVDVPQPDEGSEFIELMFGTAYLTVPQVRFDKVPSTLPKKGPAAKPTSSTAAGQEPQRVGGPPPTPTTPPAPAPAPAPTGKPAGGSGPSVPGTSPGKAAIERLPPPKTLGGWKPWKSYGPFRTQAYSVYLEHGILGWRWGITGVGPAGGRSAKYWMGKKKNAIQQAEQLLRIAWSQGRAPLAKSVLKTISRNDMLFQNTWVMT